MCRLVEFGDPGVFKKVLEDTRSNVAASDTSPKAHEIYVRRLKEMTPSERLRLGAMLWQTGDSVQRAAIRRSNPDADDFEIAFRLAVTRFGFELARKAYQPR